MRRSSRATARQCYRLALIVHCRMEGIGPCLRGIGRWPPRRWPTRRRGGRGAPFSSWVLSISATAVDRLG